MKFTCLFFILVFPLVHSASGARMHEGHDIRIRIKGLKKGDVARIGYYYGPNRCITQDSAMADSRGWFWFKGDKNLPEGVYTCTFPKGYFDFLITSQSFILETDTNNIDLDMKVKGSEENSIFFQYHKYTVTLGRRADSIYKIISKSKNKDSIKVLKNKIYAMNGAIDSFRSAFMARHPNSFSTKLLHSVLSPHVPDTPILPNGRKDSTFPYRYYKQHYFDNIDFSDGRISRTPFFEAKLKDYFKDLVIPVPDSINNDADALIEKAKASGDMFRYVLDWIVNYYDASDYMGMDAVTSHLIEKYFLTGQAKWVTPTQITGMRKRDSVVSRLLIGKTAPDLYMTDSNGKVITLYSLHHKYTILFFFESTCGHCQHVTPVLHEFYEKNKSKLDLEVYAATVENESKDWKEFIREKGIGDWVNVWDSRGEIDFARLYDVTSYPVIYILDQDKKIIGKHLDVSRLQDFFDRREKK